MVLFVLQSQSTQIFNHEVLLLYRLYISLANKPQKLSKDRATGIPPKMSLTPAPVAHVRPGDADGGTAGGAGNRID